MKINNNNFIFYFLISHIALGLGIGLLLGSIGKTGNQVLSFNIGLLLSALIVTTLSLVLKMVLFKKSFALPISVIVFKYAFLGVITYMVAASGSFDLGLSAVGIFIMAPSMLVAGGYYAYKNKTLEIEE
ncbi:MAG: hypothetical protein VX583_03080 [Bdellovibrionota bacterium]|nr:hypothetical protein [Pseudobdellovibrionaceae bacterium]|tara:strand:+ start:46287 stop:46673 length:387 start_codon:yes stop_codon:yes gene_type:complete